MTRNIFDSTRHPVPRTSIDITPPPGSGLIEDGGDTREEYMMGAGASDFPASWWVEPRDMPDLCRDNDRYRLWPRMQRQDSGRVTNQNPTSQCTCHSHAQGIEQAGREQYGAAIIQGRKGNLCVSQSHGYSLVHQRARSSPRQGANIRDVLAKSVEYGFLPEDCRDQKSIFPLTMAGTTGRGYKHPETGVIENSSGPWVPFYNLPDGWRRQTIKVLEFLTFTELWQCVCCIAKGRRVVHVGRSGHAIGWDIVAWTRYNPSSPLSTIKFGYSDSYGNNDNPGRWDSGRTASGCVRSAYAIASVTRSARFHRWLHKGTTR